MHYLKANQAKVALRKQNLYMVLIVPDAAEHLTFRS